MANLEGHLLKLRPAYMSAVPLEASRELPEIREERVLVLSGMLLGAGRLFKRKLHSRLDVHNAIVQGVFLNGSLAQLLATFEDLGEEDVAGVLGVSTRTLRRQRDEPAKSMPVNLASRTWLLAETLAKAAELLGSKQQAERWMTEPAIGLDRQRPIDMLKTVQGAELVADYLTRLEYGVYS